jgi:hypothetical protein
LADRQQKTYRFHFSGRLIRKAKAMTLRDAKLPNCRTAAVALCFGFALTAAGCSKDANVQEVKEFHHDFRGKPLPAELRFFTAKDGKALPEVQPEGLRITIAKPWIAPSTGVGIRTAFGIRGDFETTAAIEILQADTPPSGQSSGIGFFLSPVNYKTYKEATALDRYFEKGSGGVRWWATDSSRKGSAPSDDQVVRLRMTRAEGMVQYFWAPGLEGENFQLLGQADWPNEIEFIRLIAFMGKSPVNLDVRFLDFRIRAEQLTNLGVFASQKGGLAKALVIGFAVSMLLAVVAWLFFRRRRKDHGGAKILDKLLPENPEP